MDCNPTICNITPHGPDDGSVEPKCYSDDFSINLSFHLDYLVINFSLHKILYKVLADVTVFLLFVFKVCD